MRIPFVGRADQVALDPVCHMQVSTRKAPGGSSAYQGTTYYFCGPGCNRSFQKEPDAYISGEKRLDM